MSDDKYSVDCKAKKCSVYEGDNAGLDIKEGECEVRRDLMIKKAECVRIWGQIKDCRGCPVRGALVKLVKQVCKGHKCWYIGIAHTLTDCQGFYQFDICRKEEKCSYRVIAGKAAVDDRYYDEPGDLKQRKGKMIDEIDSVDEVDENVIENTLEEEDAAEEAAIDEEAAPEENEEPSAPAENSKASEQDNEDEGSDEEYPYKEKDDVFDPDEDFLGDEYDRDGCDPCRYFMKD